MSYQIATASRNSILQFCCQQNTMKQNLNILSKDQSIRLKAKLGLVCKKKVSHKLIVSQRGNQHIHTHTTTPLVLHVHDKPHRLPLSLSVFIIHYPPGNAILLFRRNRDQILHSDIAQNFHAHRRAPMWVIYQSTWVASQLFHYG